MISISNTHYSIKPANINTKIILAYFIIHIADDEIYFIIIGVLLMD